MDIESADIQVVYEAVNVSASVNDPTINVTIGEDAKIDVGEAITYIKSGQAEIKQAVNEGLTEFNSNSIEKTTAFNQNATSKTDDFNTNTSNKTTAFNENASSKTSDFNNNYTDKLGDFNSNASDKTISFNDNYTDKLNDFNSNATDKTTDFNDNYIAKKEIIDEKAEEASGYADTAKQWAVGEPTEPTGGSAKHWAQEAESSLSGLSSRVSDIEDLIPNTASSSNQLTDKDYVDTADNGLQQQIDAITAASDVTDVVGTYAQLQAYDISTLPNNSIIKVLQDESRNDETTYYRWVITAGVGAWVLIGEEGPYYTKAESDATFQEKLVSGTNIKTINNNSILGSGNVDIDALPSQTGQSGKFLTTNGTTASWETVSVTGDNKSITKNTSDELQTVGVINSRDSSTAVKTWTGTKAQYEAIATKDANTEYFCTDTGELYLGTIKIGDADLNGKADVDLTNVNASGTSLASGWAMPSNRYDNLTLGASGSTYTAPANGWVSAKKIATGAGQTVLLETENIFSRSISTAQGQEPCVTIPVSRGEVFKFTYGAQGNLLLFRFIYAEGEN